MPRGENAEAAVQMYKRLRQENEWGPDGIWKAIATLLLTCEVWKGRSWEPFHDVVVFREANDFRLCKSGEPNSCIEKAESLSQFLAHELGCPRESLCGVIGSYWRDPRIRCRQPHNLLGHAFRSIVCQILQDFGNQSISYTEEVDPYEEFPGYNFDFRSERPRIDIVARRDKETIALISTRWRYRHDRVDLVDEAYAYAPAAKRTFRDCRFIGVTGECAASRLKKVLDHAQSAKRNGPVDAYVHFQPRMVSVGLNENGRVAELKSLNWLISQTQTW